jgi:hypothetical protein
MRPRACRAAAGPLDVAGIARSCSTSSSFIGWASSFVPMNWTAGRRSADRECCRSIPGDKTCAVQEAGGTASVRCEARGADAGAIGLARHVDASWGAPRRRRMGRRFARLHRAHRHGHDRAAAGVAPSGIDRGPFRGGARKASQRQRRVTCMRGGPHPRPWISFAVFDTTAGTPGLP